MPLFWDMEEGGWDFIPYSGAASITGAYGFSSPANSLVVAGAGTGPRGGWAQTGPVDVATGQAYNVRAWVKSDLAVKGSPLRFLLIPPGYDGSLVYQFWTVARSDVAPGGIVVDVGTFVAGPQTGDELALAVTVANVVPPVLSLPVAVSGRWVVDDIDISLASEAEAEMAKRREIREALATRAATVLTGNGYALSINTVYTGPTLVGNIQGFPSVAVGHGEELKVVTTLHRKKVTDTVYVSVACKRTDTASPDDQCDDACAELEKAFEIGPGDPGANGTFLGLAYVTNVNVVGVFPEEITQEMGADVRVWTMTLEVDFTHERRNP